MAEIDAGALLPNDRVRSMALDGEVTQIHRGGSQRYAEPGDTFEIDGTTFEVTDVEERTLGDVTDADARREGSESLEAYKEADAAGPRGELRVGRFERGRPLPVREARGVSEAGPIEGRP